MKIRTRGAGGESSVILENLTIPGCLMSARASSIIDCSCAVVGQSCHRSQNFSPFGRSFEPTRCVLFRRPGHWSSERPRPENTHETMIERPSGGGSSQVIVESRIRLCRHVRSSLAGRANCNGVTTHEPAWTTRVHVLWCREPPMAVTASASCDANCLVSPALHSPDSCRLTLKSPARSRTLA